MGGIYTICWGNHSSLNGTAVARVAVAGASNVSIVDLKTKMDTRVLIEQEVFSLEILGTGLADSDRVRLTPAVCGQSGSDVHSDRLVETARLRTEPGGIVGTTGDGTTSRLYALNWFHEFDFEPLRINVCCWLGRRSGMLATLATRLAEDLHSYIDERIQEIVRLAEQQDKLIADLARKAQEDKKDTMKLALPGMGSAASRGSLARRSQPMATENRLPSYKELLEDSPTGDVSPALPSAGQKVELTPLRPYTKRCRDGDSSEAARGPNQQENRLLKLRALLGVLSEFRYSTIVTSLSVSIQRPPKRPKIPIERRESAARPPLEPIDQNVPPQKEVVNIHRAAVPSPVRPEERPNERAVVRGRDARQQLDGFACPQCTAFYSAAGFDPKSSDFDAFSARLCQQVTHALTDLARSLMQLVDIVTTNHPQILHRGSGIFGPFLLPPRDGSRVSAAVLDHD
ncbi:hypothetical protein FOZ62_013630 [Perkinsus olseni]|uniref:Uncharacterized protein n=1 Tax=Perkinsus olseni TaxID=32597 RepID=A0A7J6U2T3_PEROL|nr:hypothetical protein FOZ62_013630 [Perkinsus olseni]